eukprot:scaffold40342_cov33-Phaeocystis_antarctica.AAC.1
MSQGAACAEREPQREGPFLALRISSRPVTVSRSSSVSLCLFSYWALLALSSVGLIGGKVRSILMSGTELNNSQKDKLLKSSRAVRPDGCSDAHPAQDDEHPTA